MSGHEKNALLSQRTERRGARFHSPVSLERALSLPMRRALPLPLPDARSPQLPEGRFQPAAAPLCQIAMGTLSVPRGYISIILPAAGSRVKEISQKLPGNFVQFVRKRKQRTKFFLVPCRKFILRFVRWKLPGCPQTAARPGQSARPGPERTVPPEYPGPGRPRPAPPPDAGR